MLARNHSLTDLRMERGKIALHGLLAIATVLRRNLSSLKLLNVRGHRCNTEFACLLGESLAHSSSLITLYFGPFHSIPIQKISGRTRLSPYSLDLSALGYGPQDLSLIAGLLYGNTAITALDISSNPLTSPPSKLVMRELPIPPFDELSGYDNPETNDGPGTVHVQVDVNLLPKFPELVYGLARGSRQESILVLARHLCHMPVNNLTFLDVRNCGVDCVGAQHLATQLLRNTVLKTLVLQEVPLPIQEVRCLSVCLLPRTCSVPCC
jgi:hypothetical protein